LVETIDCPDQASARSLAKKWLQNHPFYLGVFEKSSSKFHVKKNSTDRSKGFSAPYKLPNDTILYMVGKQFHTNKVGKTMEGIVST